MELDLSRSLGSIDQVRFLVMKSRLQIKFLRHKNFVIAGEDQSKFLNLRFDHRTPDITEHLNLTDSQFDSSGSDLDKWLQSQLVI